MSETLASPMKTAPARNGASDLQMLAQVEKWMAAIRDINREPQNETAFRVRVRPAATSAIK
jgi:hypothetical protein